MQRFILPIIALALSACGGASHTQDSQTKEAWNERNAPSRLGANANVAYDSLPTAGTATTLPWSDDYWATRYGGVSFRWQTTAPGGSYRQYLYDLPSANQLAGWDEGTLSRLSPAEKYDLLSGRTDLPVTRAERQSMLGSVRNGEVPDWHGICHGWAPASYMEPQAFRAVSRRLSDGRNVTFQPSDIHALMSRFYADYHYAGNTQFLGTRCERDGTGRSGDVACRDANPGSFHLAVAHQLATVRSPFVVELDDGEQIWNHPVYGYAFSYGNFRPFRRLGDIGRARFRAPGTAYLVDVSMRLHFATETTPSTSATQTASRTIDLSYSLELDADRRVIGGEWEGSHPDFAWRITRQPVAGDRYGNLDYATLQDLLRSAQ